jgi:hypothetical protein
MRQEILEVIKKAMGEKRIIKEGEVLKMA